MISVKWKESNLKSFYKKMENIANNLENSAKESMKESMETIQKLALQYKIGKKDISMIPFTIEAKNGYIKGRLYTDSKTFAYASFLEFGTGNFAERPHIGVTKTFVESGYTYWFLPVEKAERDFGSNRIIIIKGKQFYIMYAQQPKPFMRPTGFEGREIALDIFQKNLLKMLKEAIK